MSKIKKIIIGLVIIIIIFSPLLLIIDYKKYSQFVYTIWLFSVIYYIFVTIKKTKNNNE